jgi:hypothetical protein
VGTERTVFHGQPSNLREQNRLPGAGLLPSHSSYACRAAGHKRRLKPQWFTFNFGI